MLQKVNLNIMEYRPVVENRFVSNEFRERIQKENIPEEMKKALLRPTSDSISFVNHSIDGEFEMPIRWQSKGTQEYIRILEALYNMITGSHVYYLDELGEDLHYGLLYYYLNVFIFNSEKSQLIITSQETTFLSQDLINENRGVVCRKEQRNSLIRVFPWELFRSAQEPVSLQLLSHRSHGSQAGTG